METNMSAVSAREISELSPTMPALVPSNSAETRSDIAAITAALNERRIAVVKICELTKWAVYKIEHLDRGAIR